MTDFEAIDESLQVLRSRADAWVDLPLSSRIKYLEEVFDGTRAVAERQVARAVEAKAEAGPGTGEASALREALETLSWTRTRLREEEKVVEQLRARQEKEDVQLVVREAERARLDEETRRLLCQSSLSLVDDVLGCLFDRHRYPGPPMGLRQPPVEDSVPKIG